MSDRYADHDAAWHRDMETEAAAQEPREDVLHRFKTPEEAVAWLKDEPREDVEALALKHKIEDALAATQDIDAVHALDALLARLEQTERALQTELRAVNTLRGVVEDAEARAEAAERALREIKTYAESCRDNYGFPSTVRLLDVTDAALASSEGDHG